MSDYRCVDEQQFHPDTQELIYRKQTFISRHRCTSNNWYQYVKGHRCEFNHIYDNKCIYCGVPVGIVVKSQLEIDHFICQNTCDENINELSNLVLACRKCNNSKREYVVPISKTQLFHPDNGHLPQLFCRQQNYSIIIQQQYINDNDVVEFYNALKLDAQLRRLDFLLMRIKMWRQKISNKLLKDKLAYVECVLMELRNNQV